ncbi:MAG: hypothetical protein ACJ8ER_10665 [Allosphingosinicella sp.]
MKRPSDFVAAILIFGVLPAAPAYAYLDAASVSMALQVVTGAAASALLFGKTYFARIATFVRRKPAVSEPASNQD